MKINKSVFLIKKMDCPAEENIIRMKLDDIDGIKNLEFDIQNRTLHLLHLGNLELVEERIHGLNFDASLLKQRN